MKDAVTPLIWSISIVAWIWLFNFQDAFEAIIDASAAVIGVVGLWTIGLIIGYVMYQLLGPKRR